MMTLGLEVNKVKTRIARLPEESFDFLGYTVGASWEGRAHLFRHSAVKESCAKSAQANPRTDDTSVVRGYSP